MNKYTIHIININFMIVRARQLFYIIKFYITG
nr:MAG TPA: hypothetical protein [Caudoviricetes sp.]